MPAVRIPLAGRGRSGNLRDVRTDEMDRVAFDNVVKNKDSQRLFWSPPCGWRERVRHHSCHRSRGVLHLEVHRNIDSAAWEVVLGQNSYVVESSVQFAIDASRIQTMTWSSRNMEPKSITS